MTASLINLLRRLLATKGYVVSHVETGLPEVLESYLRDLRPRRAAFEHICILDSDLETLVTFLNVFDAREIRFHSSADLENLAPPDGKDARLLLAADIAAFSLREDSASSPWLDQAAIVIVRSKQSHFWSGQADLQALTDLMARHGLLFHDVRQQPAGPPVSILSGNVFFVFERKSSAPIPAPGPQRSREFRLSEALTLLSAPIVPRPALRLTGRGSYGFAAGLSNPGAVADGGELLLLARGERAPWPVQKRSPSRYLSSCQPMLLKLRQDLQVSTAVSVRFADAPEIAGLRFEDFRLFAHGDRIYSNHPIIRYEGNRAEGTLVRPDRLQTSVGISRLDAAGAQLLPLGSPVLDRPVARVEKNWAVFSAGGGVHLIYSFNPYRLFSADAFPDLHFTSKADHRMKLPISQDGLYIRNSINPIPWDPAHFLHIVHKVFPDKRYVFWGVLLDRQTLLPTKITRRPLLTDRSSSASITYVCSAVCRGDDLLLFGGLDDCSIGAWRVPRSDLDAQWSDIACER